MVVYADARGVCVYIYKLSTVLYGARHKYMCTHVRILETKIASRNRTACTLHVSAIFWNALRIADVIAFSKEYLLMSKIQELLKHKKLWYRTYTLAKHISYAQWSIWNLKKLFLPSWSYAPLFLAPGFSFGIWIFYNIYVTQPII